MWKAQLASQVRNSSHKIFLHFSVLNASSPCLSFPVFIGLPYLFPKFHGQQDVSGCPLVFPVFWDLLHTECSDDWCVHHKSVTSWTHQTHCAPSIKLPSRLTLPAWAFQLQKYSEIPTQARKMSSSVPFRQNFWPGKWNLYGNLEVYFSLAVASVAVLTVGGDFTPAIPKGQEQEESTAGENQDLYINKYMYMTYTALLAIFPNCKRTQANLRSGPAALAWSPCSAPCKGFQETLRCQDNKALLKSADSWSVCSQHRQHQICNVAQVGK